MSLPKCDEAVVTTKHKNQHWHTACCHCHTVTVPHLREVVGICHIGGVLLHHMAIQDTAWVWLCDRVFALPCSEIVTTFLAFQALLVNTHIHACKTVMPIGITVVQCTNTHTHTFKCVHVHTQPVKLELMLKSAHIHICSD